MLKKGNSCLFYPTESPDIKTERVKGESFFLISLVLACRKNKKKGKKWTFTSLAFTYLRYSCQSKQEHRFTFLNNFIIKNTTASPFLFLINKEIMKLLIHFKKEV